MTKIYIFFNSKKKEWTQVKEKKIIDIGHLKQYACNKTMVYFILLNKSTFNIYL